ncbi:Nickel/cobalt efflux system RcnA [Anaerolineales bacterium]|nr:Nickel/cobalt efflux system RcnA [Anaerolineales bacterium]
MTKKSLFPLLFVFMLFFTNVTIVHAHPADVYAHTIYVDFSKTGLKIKWEIKPGPMLTSYIWYEADANQDGNVSPQEAEAWGHGRAALFTASLDEKPLSLQTESVQMPTDLNKFQAGEEYITITLSAELPDGTGNLVLTNGMETKTSINWFYLSAVDDIAFLFPGQQSNTIAIDFFTDRALAPEPDKLLTTWDSGAPSLPAGQQKDVVTQTAEQVVPELSQRTPQEILLDLMRTENLSLSFYAFALVISLALGALHALTPGHGKTIVAAYLVGSKGTARHAIALGSIVTLTHTGSVFALGLLTLTASRYFFSGSLLPYLELLSGVLIVLLGGGLLIPRLRTWHESRLDETSIPQEVKTEDGKKRLVIDQAIIEDAPSHKHNGAIPRKPTVGDPLAELTWRSLITLGVSGGLVPCPDAIAILLVAVAINRILLGLALIVSFSLGLAVVLIVIGMLMVGGGRLFARMNFLSRVAPFMPVVSAGVVMILGVVLTYGAAIKVQAGTSPQKTESTLSGAWVFYLAEDENKYKQIFVTEVNLGNPQKITDAEKGVTDFAISPDKSQIVFIEQTEDLDYALWLTSLDGANQRRMFLCDEANCSQPVWSPDGQQIIFEYMPLDVGTSSLWWLAPGRVTTDTAQAVFQEARLPGTNPRWSPNGEWLSYASTDGIRLTNLTTGESRVIPNMLGAAVQWSPDGKKILLRDVIIKDRQFVTQLFLYDPETGSLTNPSPSESVENILAAWSPDGKQIAVVRRDLSIPRGDQIWLMSADGSNARTITSAPAVLHGSLNWSPDGKFLLYDLYLLDSFPLESQLEVVDVSTGETTNLGILGYNPKWVWTE